MYIMLVTQKVQLQVMLGLPGYEIVSIITWPECASLCQLAFCLIKSYLREKYFLTWYLKNMGNFPANYSVWYKQAKQNPEML